MILGIAEDFSSSVVLDSELTGISTSGMSLNSGVHPSITVDNLLHFLPNYDLAPDDWAVGTTYTVFNTSRNRTDLVTYNSKIYQSILAGNIGKTPGVDTTYWLETNLESLRLKFFIQSVKDRVYSDLRLTKRLVNNQKLYEVGTETLTLPNDYAAWVFEPKGSDYTTIRLNSVSFQKTGTTPVNLYVVNQGVLKDTLTVTPSNGIVEFKALDTNGYTFSGEGKWIFAIDSTSVLTNNYTIDPLKYKGFVAYTASGTGDTAEDAEYSYQTTGNGLGFNVTAYLDSTTYIDNTFIEFANYIRATFEYMVFTMFLHNPSNRDNLQQRIQMDRDLLIAELKNDKADTVVKRYLDEKKETIKLMKRSFDTQIGYDRFQVTNTTF
jgi:hypothetical protein